MKHTNNYPKLHNAAWPGVVGKGSPGAEPFIDLDSMIGLTAQCEADGVKFDGVDIFLFAFLDFMKGVGQPLDPANKNLTAWFERMKARPSAAA